MANMKEALCEAMNDMLTGKRTNWYDPPYDSPIEDIFAWRIRNYLKKTTEMHKQQTVNTITGKYRLDFVLLDTETGLKVGVECDGEAFHKDKTKDLIRDLSIVSSTDISAIYRFQGKHIFYYEYACVWSMAQLFPAMFRENTRLLEGHYSSLDLYHGDRSLCCQVKTTDDSGWESKETIYEIYIPYVSKEGIKDGVFDNVLRLVSNNLIRT